MRGAQMHVGEKPSGAEAEPPNLTKIHKSNKLSLSPSARKDKTKIQGSETEKMQPLASG